MFQGQSWSWQYNKVTVYYHDHPFIHKRRRPETEGPSNEQLVSIYGGTTEEVSEEFNAGMFSYFSIKLVYLQAPSKKRVRGGKYDQAELDHIANYFYAHIEQGRTPPKQVCRQYMALPSPSLSKGRNPQDIQDKVKHWKK